MMYFQVGFSFIWKQRPTTPTVSYLQRYPCKRLPKFSYFVLRTLFNYKNKLVDLFKLQMQGLQTSSDECSFYPL